MPLWRHWLAGIGLLLAALLPASPAMAGRVVSDGEYHGRPPCWEEASSRYSVPVRLLKAVAVVESSNRARVVARNTNGSLDIGFMQINDWWLPHLSRYGITHDTLVDDACINVNIGAWILRQGIDRYGYNAQGIGAYGAGTKPEKAATRAEYASKVFRALARQGKGNVGGDTGAAGVARVAWVQPGEGRGNRQRGGQPPASSQQASTRQLASGERLAWTVFDND